MHAKFRNGHSHIPINNGFTLIEILVALAIGLLVIGAAYSYFISTLRTSNALVAQSRLQQEIRSAADLMQRDLRRAGYVPNGDTTNATLVNTIWIGKTASSLPNDNCVIYRYVDERGALRNGGFLLGPDGRLYMKNAGSSNTCQISSDWIAISASNFTTVSRFTVVYTGGPRPRLAIGLTGTLQNDSKVSFPLDQTITLFNAPAKGAVTTGS